MRASRTTSRGSSARRCTSASVCNTESCRCAATSARSSERMRSRRSPTSWFTSSHTPGPMIDANPTSTTAAPITPPCNALPRVDAHEERAEPGRDARDAGDDPRERAAPRPDEHRDRVGGVGREPFEERPVGQLGRVVACGASRAPPTRPSPRPAATRSRRPATARPRGPSNNTPSTTAANAIVEIASDGAAARRRGRRRHEQPARGVEQRADPAGERQHEEAAPHDVGVDADRVAEPGRDARDDATVVAAHEAVTLEAHPPMIAPTAHRRGSGRPRAATPGSGARSGIVPDGGRAAGRTHDRAMSTHLLRRQPASNRALPVGALRHARRPRPTTARRPPWRFVRRERGRMIGGVADRHGRRLPHRRDRDPRHLGRRRDRVVRHRRRRVRDLLDRVPERRAARRRSTSSARVTTPRRAGSSSASSLLGIGLAHRVQRDRPARSATAAASCGRRSSSAAGLAVLCLPPPRRRPAAARAANSARAAATGRRRRRLRPSRRRPRRRAPDDAAADDAPPPTRPRRPRRPRWSQHAPWPSPPPAERRGRNRRRGRTDEPGATIAAGATARSSRR